MNLQQIENSLSKYKSIIGVSILVMLILLSLLTINFFKKQNEIIETGGFIDGKIKCTCTQEAWDNKILLEDYPKEIFFNGTG